MSKYKMMKKKIPIFAALIIFSFSIAYASDITAFSSPENSFAALQKFLGEAKDNIYVAVYTIDSPFVMDELLNTKSNITLIVEKSPVGRISQQENNILCRLQKSNASVYLYNGSGYMHAKYIVSDDAVLVATENLGNSGFPKNGFGNRGYGAVVYDANIVNEFISVFMYDLNSSMKFICENEGRIEYEKLAAYSPPELKTYHNQSVSAIFAPDAIDDVLSLINSAEKRLYIEEFYIYRNWGNKNNLKPNEFLESAINKARNGVDVKILMDSTEYNVDRKDPNSNYYTEQYVNEIGVHGLEARLIDIDKTGVEKVHAKLFIADSTAVISSINWNEHSPLRNREAGIAVTGEAAEYYADAFMRDWSPQAPTGKATAQRHDWVIALLIILIIIFVIAFLRTRNSKLYIV